MSAGSKIHDEIGAHLKCCDRCRGVDPENRRLQYPGRRSVSEATFVALCGEGRWIYKAYLRWLAEGDD